MKKLKYVFLFLLVNASAQMRISLEEAINKALTTNFTIKTNELVMQQKAQLQKSAVNIEPTAFNTEIGQLNSAYTDNRFSVSQNLKFPGFYKAQKQLLLEEYKSAVLSLKMQKWQIKKEVELLYHEMLYLDAKQKLLMKADSIFSKYLQRAELRLKKGESNLLEKASAENLKSQARLQLKAIETDKSLTIQKLSFLINDGMQYQNIEQSLKPIFLSDEELKIPSFNFNLKLLEQEKAIQNARLGTEKSKLKPTINLGYNNLSIYGLGVDGVFYTRSQRFHSGMVGLSVPIFNGAQRALIEAQKMNQEIAEYQYRVGQLQLNQEFNSIKKSYQRLLNDVEYYEKTGLANSEDILNTANSQFSNGAINYLEWAILVNQAFDVKNQYLDRVRELNAKAISLMALTQQNTFKD